MEVLAYPVEVEHPFLRVYAPLLCTIARRLRGILVVSVIIEGVAERERKAMAKDPRWSELAHWLREAKTASEEMEAAKEAAEKWLQRARLAKDAAREDLLDEAAEQAMEAKRRFERARQRHEDAQLLRRRLLEERPEVGQKEQRYAQALLDMFEELGFDPQSHELDELVKQNELQERIAAIREAQGLEEPIDPLELLRARMNAYNTTPDSEADANKASPSGTGVEDD